MKHLRLLAFSLAIVALFSGVVATPSYAGLQSDHAQVILAMNPNNGTYPMTPGYITCKSATLISDSYTSYTAYVQPQFGWNKCNLVFSNVELDRTYTLSFTYTENSLVPKTYTERITIVVKSFWGSGTGFASTVIPVAYKIK